MKKGIILAAGLGKRMGGKSPKVLFPIKGKSLIRILLSNVYDFFDKIIVVVGFQGDSVIKEVNLHFKNIEFAYQDKQLGTADAVKSAMPFIHNNDEVFILNGDVPLLKINTLKEMYGFSRNNKCNLSVGILRLKDPAGYGRIVMVGSQVVKIVEEKDANEQEKLIERVNGGLFYTEGYILRDYLGEIKSNNTQKEFYLTDIVSIVHLSGKNVCGYLVKNNEELFGINTKEQLLKVEKYV